MSEEQIIDFLMRNTGYFVTNDFIVAIIRTIGWMLVKGVDQLIEGSKTIYNAAFNLIDITRYTGVEAFIDEYKPLLQVLLIVSLMILGYIYLLGKEKRHDLLTSLLIFAVVVTSSTYLFSTLNDFTVMFKDAVISSGDNADGKELIRQNLYDLRYIDGQIGLANMDASGDIPQYPDFSDTDLRMINIAEVLPDDEEGLTEGAQDILSKNLKYLMGGSYLEDVYNGVAMTSFGNTYYFRYQFHYGTYFLNAFALILLYFGLGYVNVKIIVELLRSRVLVVLFSADLSSKKKAVRILESIRDGYYALCFTAIQLRLYLILTEYINSKTFLSPLVRGILLVFVAFTMIEGSSIAEKITGVDAGITATTHRLMGAAHAVRGAAQMAMQAKQLSSLNKMSKGYGSSETGRGLDSGYASNSGDDMSGMPGNGQEDSQTHPSGNSYSETDTQNKGSVSSESERENMYQGRSESDRESMYQGRSESDQEKMYQGRSESDQEKMYQGRSESDQEKMYQGRSESDQEKMYQGRSESDRESMYQGRSESDRESMYQGRSESDQESMYQGRSESDQEKMYQGKSESDQENLYQGRVESESENTYQGKNPETGSSDANISSMDNMHGNAANTNLESGKPSAAEKHFDQMDQALGKSGIGNAEQNNTHRESPEMTSAYDRKGMFERRSEQSHPDRNGATPYKEMYSDDRKGEKSSFSEQRSTTGTRMHESRTVSREMENTENRTESKKIEKRMETTRQKFNSKKEKGDE